MSCAAFYLSINSLIEFADFFIADLNRIESNRILHCI